MDFTRYTQDKQYRASMQQYRVAVHIGTNGTAYEYHIPSTESQWLGRDHEVRIVRHNKKGGYTHIL